MTVLRTLPRAIAALLLAVCGAVPAQTAEATSALRTRSLASHCAQCHGTDGRAPPGAEVPGLAGLQAGYIVEQMKAFRSGSRTSSVMQQLAKGYDDAEIAALAEYFAAQKK